MFAVLDGLRFAKLLILKPNRRFEFEKTRSAFRQHGQEALTVTAMRVSNPDRSPLGIDG